VNSQPSPQSEAPLDDDILTLSSAEIREGDGKNFIYDMLILGSILVLGWAVAMSYFFFIIKLLLLLVLLWAAIASLAPQLIVLNKSNNSITVSRTLFSRWTISERKIPLDSYYGVRLRRFDGENVSYIVELVGKYGATLTLLKYTDLHEARDLRSTIEDWLGVKVLFDPFSPDCK
jgi:hypothetical protein